MGKELNFTMGMEQLMADLRLIVNSAKARVASAANTGLTMMYWHIGHRVNVEILGNERAAYGKQIVAQVSRQLQAEYGSKGFDEKSLRRMMQFASLFTDERIVATVSRQLSWSGSEEQIELLQLDKAGIKVAQYMTELPPRELLVEQIRKSLELAKELGEEKNMKDLFGEG